jgi:hypothetical protein
MESLKNIKRRWFKMGKAQILLEKLGGVKEAGNNIDKEDKEKGIVPINEPVEDEKSGDDFSDLHPDEEGDKKEEDKPDEFTQSVLDVLKHAKDKDEDFDQDQLAAGIKVEGEHTDNKWIAAAIAKSHLVEFPTYYVALAKMEIELKAEKEKGDKKEDPDKKDKEIAKEEEPKKDNKEDENDI